MHGSTRIKTRRAVRVTLPRLKGITSEIVPILSQSITRAFKRELFSVHGTGN